MTVAEYQTALENFFAYFILSGKFNTIVSWCEVFDLSESELRSAVDAQDIIKLDSYKFTKVLIDRYEVITETNIPLKKNLEAIEKILEYDAFLSENIPEGAFFHVKKKFTTLGELILYKQRCRIAELVAQLPFHTQFAMSDQVLGIAFTALDKYQQVDSDYFKKDDENSTSLNGKKILSVNLI